MHFEVLGPLRVVSATGRSVRIPESKVRVLLAVLLVQDGAPVSVDRLAQDLWGDRQPTNPAAALQRKVWQLRRALEGAEPGARELIVFGPAGYALRPRSNAQDTVDAAAFLALTEHARTTEDAAQRAGLLAEALTMWQGPALADFRDEEFAAATVTRLEERRLVALEEHAEVRLGLGEHGQLAGELAGLVMANPMRERLRAAYLRALYRSGRASEALDSYQELRDRLAADLGLDPGPELAALHQAILEQDPDLAGPAQDVPAARGPVAAVRTNLPTPLTSLIGRAAAVGEVTSRLAGRRLVTLTGPGGVGKTRLAVGTAEGLVDEFADGIWMVELAGRDCSAENVVDAVAGVLGLRDDTGLGMLAHTEPVPPVHGLAEALRQKSLLLVLDSCEHLVDEVAELAGPLLAAVPGLRVLATSREPLGLAGESVWEVPSLEVPEVSAEPSAVGKSSAVQLFVARAADAAGGFELTGENVADVATLCRRLDGIPLALELAATRVRALGVAGLVGRLDDRFRLLATGHRGAPHRQQTLRAMIDWSWDMLTEPERVVLRRLAVPTDGCTLEAAEAVCADAGLPAADVLDLLTRLVSRSLVVVMDGARFRLLESVASYCLQRLHEAGEHEEVRHRHLDFYLDLAERADSGLRGSRQLGWLATVDAESANLRVAVDGALQLGRPDLALRLVNALAWYWILRGRLREGRRFLTTALSAGGGGRAARAEAMIWESGMAALLGDCPVPVSEGLEPLEDIDDAGARARAEWFLAFSRLSSGDVALNEELLGHALTGFETTGDRWGQAAALSARADLAAARGELATMAADGGRSLELFRELGDRWGRLKATAVLGSLAEITADYRTAVEHRREGLAIAEELGLWSDASHELSGLGRLALLTGDLAEAERLHRRARQLAIEQSTQAGQHVAEVGLAVGARRQGDFAGAERYLVPWLAWCDEVGWLPGKALVLAELGFTAEQRGDVDDALTLHLDGLEVARATCDPRAVALALEGVAGAEARLGRHARSTRLLGVAATARESVGAPLPEAERGDVDRAERTLRAALGSAVFETELENGRAWELEHCLRTLTRSA